MSSRFLFEKGVSKVENVHTLPLEALGLQVYTGWNDEIADQLIERSKEEEIRRFTGRDAAERFVDRQTAAKWYGDKGHVVYALGQETTLAGIIWFAYTPKPGLDADYTFAIRMYESQRGRGLAGTFLEAALTDFASRARYEGNFWLEADESNERAVHFYEKHDYRKIETKDGRVLMVRKGSKQGGEDGTEVLG
jgi:ribosomal protein S18 acetylase RimI-like enzyme